MANSGLIVVSDGNAKRRRLRARVAELWSIWCEEARRPKSKREIPQEAEEALIFWVEDGWEQEHLAYIVRSAARIRPMTNDEQDVKRMLRALEFSEIEAQASAAYESGAKVWPFEVRRPKAKMQRSELEEVLESEWSGAENPVALRLMQRMTRDQALALHDEILRRRAGTFPMSPSDFEELRRTRKWRGQKEAKTSRGSNGYDSGNHESAAMDSVDIYLDKAAGKAQLDGLSPARIRRFHEQAPSGYWQSVGELVDSGMGVTKAYEKLIGEYGWHPRERTPV